MATNKGNAPQPKTGVNDNSISYSPGSKEYDSSIKMHFNTQPSGGGLNKIDGKNPETGTYDRSQATAEKY